METTLETSTLPLSLSEADCLRRSLLEYRRLLTLSSYAAIDESTILPEVHRVDALSERLNLCVFYDETVGGDGE
jgi:hypothetical protein